MTSQVGIDSTRSWTSRNTTCW